MELLRIEDRKSRMTWETVGIVRNRGTAACSNNDVGDVQTQGWDNRIVWSRGIAAYSGRFVGDTQTKGLGSLEQRRSSLLWKVHGTYPDAGTGTGSEDMGD